MKSGFGFTIHAFIVRLSYVGQNPAGRSYMYVLSLWLANWYGALVYHSGVQIYAILVIPI